MKKRILSLILCISILTGVLVGCGGSENKNTETEQNTEQNTQMSTELDTETVTEQVKYYSVSEEDLEYSLYKVWNLLAQYDRALITKEIYGECPNSPKNFAMGCKTYKGNLTILQETNKDIIFSQNFVSKGSGGYSRLYNDLEDSIYYLGDVQVFVDVVATNFEGSFIYKEGTKQVIKVVMDFHAYSVKSDISEKYNDDTYDDLYVIYFTKEAGNTDVWLIDYMQYYAPEQAESGHWNIDDSRYLNAVLAQEDFTLLVNEDSDNIDVGNTYYNAYIAYLKNEFSDYIDAYYYLADFDGDGLKELIYDGDAGYYLLTYYDGKVIKNELSRWLPDVGHLSDKNILMQEGEPARGLERTIYFHLENGKIVIDNEISYFIDDELNETTYYLNDNPISKEEYDNYKMYYKNLGSWGGTFNNLFGFESLINEFMRES